MFSILAAKIETEERSIRVERRIFKETPICVRCSGVIYRKCESKYESEKKKNCANDKRCLLEARVSNRQPVVVSHNADTIHQAFEIASEKLLRSLDTMVGKLTDRNSPKDFLVEEFPLGDTEDQE